MSATISKTKKRDTRCAHVSADGRRCRLQRSANRRYCLSHWNSRQEYANAKRISKQLLGSLDQFKTANSINQALGKLFALVAKDRIPTRHANLLAYISQLLLQSLPSVAGEVRIGLGHEVWADFLKRTAEVNTAPPDQRPLAEAVRG